MNKRIFLVLVVSLLSLLTIGVLAHSGGTDSSGGHWNHSTGEYHYHHGKPAHQHYEGVCPYSAEESTPSEDTSTSTTTTMIRKIAKKIIAVLGFLVLMIYPVSAIYVGIRDIRNGFPSIILIIIGIWMSIGFIYLFKDIII